MADQTIDEAFETVECGAFTLAVTDLLMRESLGNFSDRRVAARLAQMLFDEDVVEVEPGSLYSEEMNAIVDGVADAVIERLIVRGLLPKDKLDEAHQALLGTCERLDPDQPLDVAAIVAKIQRIPRDEIPHG